jgi:hypothetical protein
MKIEKKWELQTWKTSFQAFTSSMENCFSSMNVWMIKTNWMSVYLYFYTTVYLFIQPCKYEKKGLNWAV